MHRPQMSNTNVSFGALQVYRGFVVTRPFTRKMSLSMLQADCKRAVASLSALSNDELSTIIDDDDRIADILKQLDRVSVTHSFVVLCMVNCSLAGFSERS